MFGGPAGAMLNVPVSLPMTWSWSRAVAGAANAPTATASTMSFHMTTPSWTSCSTRPASRERRLRADGQHLEPPPVVANEDDPAGQAVGERPHDGAVAGQ